MNGRAALVTAADDSPVRRATSTRETGPWVSTSSNTVAAAGLVMGALTGVLRGMSGTLGGVINFVKNLILTGLSVRWRPPCPLIAGEPFVPPSTPAVQFDPSHRLWVLHTPRTSYALRLDERD